MKKLVFPAFLLICWEITARSVGKFYFPTLSVIFETFMEDVVSGQLLIDIATSGERFILGLMISLPVGILIGTTIGINKTLKEFVQPTLNGLRVVPPSSLIPLIIMLIGVSSKSVLFMIFISSVIPILVASIDGISSSVDRFKTLVENLELSTFTAVKDVYLPAAMPQVLIGADLSVTMAFRMLVFSEFMGVNSGIGFRLLESATFLSYSRVYYLLLVLSLLGAAIFYGMNGFKNRVIRWS